MGGRGSAVQYQFGKTELYPLQYKEEEISRYVSRKRNFQVPSNMRILVSFEAFFEWNERIGPPVIRNWLTKYLHSLDERGRIRYFPGQYGLVDQEILFSYRKYGEILVITRFWTRVSWQDENWKIRDFKRLSYEEKIQNLKIPDNQIVKKMRIIPYPKIVLEFSTKVHQYLLEIFQLQGGKESLVLYREGQPFLAGTSDDLQSLIDNSHSVAYVLRRLGYDTPPRTKTKKIKVNAL